NMIDNLYYCESTNSLVGSNNNILLEKEIIKNMVQNKNILLTLFFDFLILSFLGGYTLLGGFNQVEYLPAMQKAHVKSLREIGEYDLADEFASRITDGLICGMTPLKYDSSIDMIWHHNSTDGKFNGNLDRGLTEEDLGRIYNTPVNEMIMNAMDTIRSIVK
ncbi:MAG: hypothetical protein JW982_11910, partial [Spirochaetes bacterium]|nr:hypothetical protein [Spirochaetota bacterium]